MTAAVSWVSVVNGGAQHVDAIECGFGVDRVLVTLVGEGSVGDGAVKMLAHLVFSDHFADGFPDTPGAGQSPGGHAGGDGGQQGFGGRQQFGAFAGTLVGQGGVAAGDQPFPGVVGVADFGEVDGVEQAHLQRPVIGGQSGDRRGPQCGEPADPAEFTQRIDAGGGDHAAIAHHDHVVEPEGVFDGGDRFGERGRVGGVAGEHPDRHRAPGRVGEQPVFDLFAAFLAVTGVAASGQFAVPPGHPRGRQVKHRDP